MVKNVHQPRNGTEATWGYQASLDKTKMDFGRRQEIRDRLIAGASLGEFAQELMAGHDADLFKLVTADKGAYVLHQGDFEAIRDLHGEVRMYIWERICNYDAHRGPFSIFLEVHFPRAISFIRSRGNFGTIVSMGTVDSCASRLVEVSRHRAAFTAALKDCGEVGPNDRIPVTLTLRRRTGETVEEVRMMKRRVLVDALERYAAFGRRGVSFQSESDGDVAITQGIAHESGEIEGVVREAVAEVMRLAEAEMSRCIKEKPHNAERDEVIFRERIVRAFHVNPRELTSLSTIGHQFEQNKETINAAEKKMRRVFLSIVRDLLSERGLLEVAAEYLYDPGRMDMEEGLSAQAALVEGEEETA